MIHTQCARKRYVRIGYGSALETCTERVLSLESSVPMFLASRGEHLETLLSCRRPSRSYTRKPMGSRATASVCALTRYPCRAHFDVVCGSLLSFITVTSGRLDARTPARDVYVQDGHRRSLLEGYSSRFSIRPIPVSRVLCRHLYRARVVVIVECVNVYPHQQGTSREAS